MRDFSDWLFGFTTPELYPFLFILSILIVIALLLHFLFVYLGAFVGAGLTALLFFMIPIIAYHKQK